MGKNNDLIEKARQVGDMHPNKPWVWTEYKPGKFDWRSIKGQKGKQATAAGGSNKTAQNPATQQKQQAQAKPAPQQQKPAAGKRLFDGMTPDEIVNYANSASTSALESAVNDKKLNKDIRQIAFNVLKKRDDYDRTKVDSSDLAGGDTYRSLHRKSSTRLRSLKLRLRYLTLGLSR